MKKLILVATFTLIGILSVNWVNETDVIKSSDCNKQTVLMALRNLDIQFKDVVFAQIMLESGDLNSRLFKRNNNMLGMKQPSKRETTSLGKTNGYATYGDWYSCLEDYVLYQKSILSKKHLTKKQYIAYISKHYAKDPEYKHKIETKIEEYLALN
jgi:hypothetical protein